jgi:DNA polymerase III epsilon subunit-like protein
MQPINFTIWFETKAHQLLKQSIDHLNLIMDEQIQIYKKDCKPHTNYIPPEYLQFQAEKCLESFKMNIMTQLKQACFNHKFITHDTYPVDKPIKLNTKNTLLQRARLSFSSYNLQSLPQLAFVDIETDSADVHSANMLQIAIVKPTIDLEHESLNYTTVFNSYILPHPNYTQKDNKAYHINHIGDEQLKSAMPIKEAAFKISSYLEDTYIVGYNVNSFDIPIIKRHLIKFCLKSFHKLSIDLYPASWRNKKHKLQDAIEAYNLFFNSKPHDALADAECCIDLLNELIERHELPNTEKQLIELSYSPENIWKNYRKYKIVDMNPDHDDYTYPLLPTPASSLKRKHSDISAT